VDLYGSQRLEVKAGLVPTDKSAPTLQSLGKYDVDEFVTPTSCPRQVESQAPPTVTPRRWHASPVIQARDADGSRPTPSATEKTCFSSRLDLRSAANGEVGDHAIVQVEVKHVAEYYEATDTRSKPESQLVVRVRRRPKWLVHSNDEGTGSRAFFTFTLAPFTLFRTPHSGRNVSKSSDVAKLEAATFGAGLMAVWEPWDFDRNTPVWPFLAPQLHAGVLSTIPTTTSLTYPRVSLVVGGGLRTGVDTAPDATVESALKLLVWGEYLVNNDDRREESSFNLLFGFGVDVGSFGN
jgi:hypothetical protein